MTVIYYASDIISCILLYHRIPDSIGKDIEKKCQSIYPLHDVCIRKVKVLKKPKFDGEPIIMYLTLSCAGFIS